jgi:phage gpG-like protein
MARSLIAGVVACVCAWAVAAFWAAPVRDAVAARVGVDDRGAISPLQLDPLIQRRVRLTGSGESGEGEFGHSVALSSDGDTALVGAPDENGEVGGAWVFTRSGSTWTQQGAELTGSGEIGAGWFGSSVAVSADGEVALIGGRSDNPSPKEPCCGVGAVWVFTRTGSTWTQQGTKLASGPGSGNAEFGSSVALSSNGRTALIGAPGTRNVGAAWIFTRAGSEWKQSAKLTARGAVPYAGFGNDVALSSNGDTALIGGAGGSTGAAWVFTRLGSTWRRRAKLTGSGEGPQANFGESLALSFNGKVALVGAASDTEGSLERVGAAWIFTRAGSTWVQRAAKFRGGTGRGENGRFGASVALSADSKTALIGEDGDNAAWAFESQP